MFPLPKNILAAGIIWDESNALVLMFSNNYILFFATFKSSYHVTHTICIYPYYPLLISPATPPIIPSFSGIPCCTERTTVLKRSSAMTRVLRSSHKTTSIRWLGIGGYRTYLDFFLNCGCEIYVHSIFYTDLHELIFTVQVHYRTGFAGKEHVHQQYHSSYRSSCLS